MTFSVLCSDGKYCGAAAASHSIGVGSRVLWSRPGVGVVATQAATRPEYGTEILTVLDNGSSVIQSLQKCIRSDKSKETRQLAVLDTTGNAAQFSGSECSELVEERKDGNGCVQGNGLRKLGTAASMLKSLNSQGSLAVRLLASLLAGEDAGGNEGCTRSAAIVVANDSKVILDLRIDDHSDPVNELNRLYWDQVLEESIGSARDVLIGSSDASEADVIVKLRNLNSREATREIERVLWLGTLLIASGQLAEGRLFINQALKSGRRPSPMFMRAIRNGSFDSSLLRRLREIDDEHNMMEI